MNTALQKPASFRYWMLEDKTLVGTNDIIEWGRWMESADRHVALTESEMFRISTVFLGLDHGWNGIPLYFETMIFESQPHLAKLDEHHIEIHNDLGMMRYTTWDEAKAGHALAVIEANKVETKIRKETMDLLAAKRS